MQYTATHRTYESEWGERHLISLEVIYTELGDIYVDASYHSGLQAFPSSPYREPLESFSPASTALGALRPVQKPISTMIEGNLSAVGRLEID